MFIWLWDLERALLKFRLKIKLQRVCLISLKTHAYTRATIRAIHGLVLLRDISAFSADPCPSFLIVLSLPKGFYWMKGMISW